MTCLQSSNLGSLVPHPGATRFATEAECLQACKEGACCNGTTCSVKPQCQCNAAAGEVFKGVGTVCSPNPCLEQACGCGLASEVRPSSLTVEFGGFTFSQNENDPFLISGEAENQQDGMTGYMAGMGQIALPLYKQGELIYEYGTVGCSTSAIGQLVESSFYDVGCQNCPPEFYANVPILDAFNNRLASPSIRVSLACSGQLDRRYDERVSPERWTFWRPVRATGNILAPTYEASECGNQLWRFDVYFVPTPFVTGTIPYFVTPLCNGQFEQQEFEGYIGATSAALVTDMSQARYSAVGTIRITPNYSNPLP